MNFDIDTYLQDKYYEAIQEYGLDYSPEEFLAEFDLDYLAGEIDFYNPIYKRLEDFCYERWGDEGYDKLDRMIDSRAKRLIDNYDPDLLEDVRYNEADRRDYNRDSLAYYGVSKSNFYGV